MRIDGELMEIWPNEVCDTCTNKVRKIRDVEAGANELHLKMDVSGFPSLDDIGDEDPDNHILSWADINRR